jgi:hypothetical protein
MIIICHLIVISYKHVGTSFIGLVVRFYQLHVVYPLYLYEVTYLAILYEVFISG